MLSAQRCYTDVETFPSVFQRQTHGFISICSLQLEPFASTEVTFDNIAVNRGSEVLSGLLVEVLAVDDPHLFEESRLAALASAEQQDLHQPLHVRFLPGEGPVDLLGLSELFHLAAVQQADG